MHIAPGTRLGRYEIRSSLGAGGMGEVYLAYDRDLERDVAIKVLSALDSSDRDRDLRFSQEAKAASGLNHPNVISVFEVGSQDGVRFIAMELVRGETLRERIKSSPITVGEAVGIATQIAAGLAAAHGAGIVHRDMKPENVIIRPDGYVKVLDFGLAKLRESRRHDAATVLKTAPGLTVGTLAYMSPEQLTSSDVTPASDVFSLGVVLYEKLAGRRPFGGTTASELIGEIVSKKPESLTDVPQSLQRIVSRALAKDPKERYADAAAMLADLRAVSGVMPLADVPRRQRRIMWMAAIALIAIAAAGGVLFLRSRRIATAKAQIAVADVKLRQFDYASAFETASLAARVLPKDDRLQEIIVQSSERLTIRTEPAGAVIFLQRYKGPAERLRVGVTPLVTERLPRGDYILTAEKNGYAPAIRPLTTTPPLVRGVPLPTEATAIELKLVEASRVPKGMVYVRGGECRLSGWYRASDKAVKLDDFLIDQYEVTNADFEEFVRAGGYRRRDLWPQQFSDEAMAKLRDKTGLNAPRSWSGGVAPSGRGRHPVTDISWYEAAAFARWKGKTLPTVYQFEQAARYPVTRSIGNNFPWGIVGEGVDATERANFLGKGTVPVDANPFGVAASGAYQLAGNVSEWCSNVDPPGHAARGGGWNDAVYAYGRTLALPDFYSSPMLGFRCVKAVSESASDQGGFALDPSGFIPEYKAVDDAEYARIAKRYEYAPRPLNARAVETMDGDAWRREKIEFDGVDGKRIPAYLYLPKGFAPPYQVIYFSPGGDVTSGWRALPQSLENTLAPAIRSGRAVFSVVLEGYLGRPRLSPRPNDADAEYVEYVVGRVTELRRGLDYVQSRRDLDAARIGFLGPSAGAASGVVLTGVEDRFRSVMFIGTGIDPTELGVAQPARRVNFAPRIRGPKLMLQGLYDEDSPLKSSAEPLFRLLREPKRLVVFEGSHSPTADVLVPAVQKWMDETLGPVK